MEVNNYSLVNINAENINLGSLIITFPMLVSLLVILLDEEELPLPRKKLFL